MQREIDALKAAVNRLSMRLLIQDQALRAAFENLPKEARRDIAECFRGHTASAMQEFADRLTPDIDTDMTSHIASILEAVGEPPPRRLVSSSFVL